MNLQGCSCSSLLFILFFYPESRRIGTCSSDLSTIATMGTRTVNLDTYSLSLLTAKEDILNPRSSTNWALFTYEGGTNKLKLADSGAGGVAELAEKFHISKPQYGLCNVTSDTGAAQIAMILWVGQNVDDYRRTECTSHLPAIKNFFKEAHVFIGADKAEDVTEEKVKAELSQVLSHNPTQWVRRSSRSADKEELVGTNYRKTNAAMEMRRINRDSFWARAEREEEERKEEERRRASEERRRLEKERVLKEKQETDERDRKMNEKLQLIEEQRRKQAEQEEELRKSEKQRWEQQQREHEDDKRARLSRSESIEKAAEAAVLVSQRSINPREFFRQLSASSQSPTSPGSSRTGKPFRRYQRSLTDTAFIFSKAERDATSPPHTPPLVSPFSRAPPSPFHRATSPPTSPDFRAVASPQKPSLSPPTSPPTTPPALALPSIPHTDAEPRAASPPEPSAPPASPTLVVSVSPIALINSSSQSHSQSSPSHIQTQFEVNHHAFDPMCYFPLDSPSKSDNHNRTELVSDISYKVQAVLVEEDEEEDDDDDDEEDKSETQPEVCPEPEELIEHKEEEEEEEQQEEDKLEKMEPAEMVQVTKDVGEGSDQSEGSPPPPESAKLSDKEEEEEEEEEEPAVKVLDAEPVCQDIKCETIVLSTNGLINGENTEEQNGTVRSLSPSDTESGTGEPTVYNNLHGSAEEEDFTDQQSSENGQKVSAERQLCVRALYDYQAEDESEISFEPGDIIKDVETVDKAWWKGWSKDGHQGLFPANYVETI
ncbi:drebrin-like protein A [Gouania willdenowi]|uniref:Drebrin n=1 Tax=Gouania willdenowi TaxID=441366 RepID=A0A8C5I909_GOUWI|nr:drebrin-like protein A [Gouania willdenowi]